MTDYELNERLSVAKARPLIGVFYWGFAVNCEGCGRETESELCYKCRHNTGSTGKTRDVKSLSVWNTVFIDAWHEYMSMENDDDTDDWFR